LARKSPLQLSPTAVVLAVTAALFLDIFMLQPVTPLDMAAAGGSRLEVGAATSVLALGTVTLELVTGMLVGRLPAPGMLAVSALVFGLASIGYAFVSGSITGLLVLTLLRGTAFGVGTVSTSYLVAAYARRGGQGAAMGIYGLAVSIPGIFGPSLGLFLHTEIGPAPAYAVAGAPCLLVGVAAAWLTARGTMPAPGARLVLAWRALPVLLPVVAVMVLMTMSYSAFLTFGPLLLPIHGAAAASVFFFAMGVARAPSRALAGLLSDRFDAGWILVAGALVTAAGGAISGLGGGVVALLAGGAVYGVGIGAIFSAAYVAMLERSDESAHGLVSAAWNVSVDGGIAIGGTSLAVVIETAGVPGLQAAVPALATLAGCVALLDKVRRHGLRASAQKRAAPLAPALTAENQGGDREP
jgi:MFS family permease